MEVVFVTPEGLRLNLKLLYSDTVDEMKRKIHMDYGIPVVCQRLILGGQVMEDARDTAYYGIEAGCEIGLEVTTMPIDNCGSGPNLEGIMVVTLRHVRQEVRVLVSQSDAVRVLRGIMMSVKEIREQLRLPPRGREGPYRLLFHGNVLNDDASFQRNGIQTGDVIVVYHTTGVGVQP